MNVNSLYYIRDYSGNYYRVSKNDQLVVAVDETEASVFTFAQANRRICVGKKSSFYFMTPIEEQGDLPQEDALQEDLPQEDALQEDLLQGEASEEWEPQEEYRTLARELADGEGHEPIEKNVSSYNLTEMDWVEYMTHFTYVASAAKDYKDDLTQQLSDIDQKICDILHYIELCETEDNEAADLVELLRVCRENRREIKDELVRIDYFRNNFGTSSNVAKAQQILKSMKSLDNRKYKPRKYEELFENCVMKTKKVPNEKTASETEIRKMESENVPSVFEESGEIVMTNEKRDTPYDGKENNWLNFARQQAEFYGNARQYIVNLRITINEIEQETEKILEETEAASCNVIQGYQMFKRLKDLRIERKARIQELNCMYALTKRVDCDALAEVLEGNLAEIKEVMGIDDETDMTNGQVLADEDNQVSPAGQMQDMVG